MFYDRPNTGRDGAAVDDAKADREQAAEIRRTPIRWECACRQPPVLLGTYEPGGRVHIKVRDRYWHVEGRVETVCPRCGAEHALDPVMTEGEDPTQPTQAAD